MRRFFAQKFDNPRLTDSGRFVWDYWHIEDQYTLIRTPAQSFFPKPLFAKFEQALRNWGRQQLGCLDISPPWLSYYVEGCQQRLHADIPHGPWAFVYSLTNWKSRKFRGGETLILKDTTLSYWPNFRGDVGQELEDIVWRVPAHFNQLLVFDPKFPHGVEPVSGVHDPREARLVIHGWFHQPHPLALAGLSQKSLNRVYPEWIHAIGQACENGVEFVGSAVVQLEFSPSGQISHLDLSTISIYTRDGKKVTRLQFLRWLAAIARDWQISRQKSKSRVVLPLSFE